MKAAASRYWAQRILRDILPQRVSISLQWHLTITLQSMQNTHMISNGMTRRLKMCVSKPPLSTISAAAPSISPSMAIPHLKFYNRAACGNPSANAVSSSTAIAWSNLRSRGVACGASAAIAVDSPSVPAGCQQPLFERQAEHVVPLVELMAWRLAANAAADVAGEQHSGDGGASASELQVHSIAPAPTLLPSTHLMMASQPG